MNNLILFIFILVFIPSLSGATVDIRLGGGWGLGVGNNSDSMPKLDGGQAKDFSIAGYNLDILLSEYWLVLGARAEGFNVKTNHYFYFDTTDNQYTRYDVRTENRSYSGIVGFHFELNREEADNPNGQKALYSAAILGVIPFDTSHDIEIESRNAVSDTKIQGSGSELKQWAVYFEANRSIPRGFTTGMQIGYRFYKVENIEDSNGSPILDYRGNPLELDLSHIDFKLFIGIRF